MLSESSGNATLRPVNHIFASYLQKGHISLSGMVISRSGQQQLYVSIPIFTSIAHILS